MPHESVDQLLKSVRAGFPSAYLTIFEEYYAQIERYAYCLLQDSAAAAQAASETFEIAFRSAKGKQPSLLPYPAELYLTCRRTALRGRLRSVSSDLLRQPSDPPDYGAQDLDELSLSVILCRERNELIQSALDNLPLPDREIIHLAFEPELDRDLIARILKISISAVTARLYQALRRLGAAVRHAGYASPESQRSRPGIGKLSVRT